MRPQRQKITITAADVATAERNLAVLRRRAEERRDNELLNTVTNVSKIIEERKAKESKNYERLG
jgi:hypothetical protein